KKRAYYYIVVADARNPRDGRFIKQVGTYNPKLPREDENRVRLNGERIAHWLKAGVQPTERVAYFLGKAGLAPMPERRDSVQKMKPKAKAVERAREKEEKLKAKAEAEAAAAAAPAEEVAVEDAAAEA